MLDAQRPSSGLVARVSERDVLERLGAGVRAGQSRVRAISVLREALHGA